MRDPWFQAFLLLPPRICGVDLLPFSLAHDYILRQKGNPYAYGDTADEAQLFEAVQICGRTWEQNKAFQVGREPGNWQKRLALWSMKWSRKMDFAIADASFRLYLDEYRLVATHRDPPPKPDAEPVTPSASPAHWQIVFVLRSQYHMTQSQAWNCAVNDARCSFDVWAESNGDDTLDSMHDMRVNELMAEAKAHYDAGELDKMEAKYSEVTALCDANMKAKGG